MQKECSFSSCNHLIPSMPESASAVSQIAGEEHKRGKQVKEVEKRENVRVKTETGKREIQVFKDGWCQKSEEDSSWHRESGSVANHMAEAEASLNMECDRSLKYGGIGAQKPLGSWISAAASYCVGKCWLLTAGISLLAEDQKEIHRDKKSLIKGSGRLWPRLQQTCLLASVCIHLGMQNNFRTFAKSASHCIGFNIVH